MRREVGKEQRKTGQRSTKSYWNATYEVSQRKWVIERACMRSESREGTATMFPEETN